ncbi:MAG TPA: hypothetical protein VIE41_16720 [Methylomirabilota bacterium]|jgi:hypothetical protein
MRRLVGVLVVIVPQTCLAAIGSARPAGSARERGLALVPAFPYPAPYDDVRLKP